MFEWNLTAKTILSVTEWKKVFEEVVIQRLLFTMIKKEYLTLYKNFF